MTHASMHDRGENPLELPYRSELLATLSALVAMWSRPGFQADLATAAGMTGELSGLQAIRLISFHPGLRPSELADELGTGRSNASKVLGRLAKAGFVELVPDEEDGRSSIIRLTDAGTEVAQRTYDIGDAMVGELVSTWSQADMKTFITLSQRFTAASREYAARLRRDVHAGSAVFTTE